jgi:ribosomal protein L11 methyltransferase
MPWHAVTLELDAGLVEAFGDALLTRGAESVSLDHPDAPSPSLQVLFPLTAAVRGLMVEAAEECGVPLPAFRLERLEDADWVRLTQAQFPPLRIGERLWIVPSWHEAPKSAVVVRLDPGLAFGTGSHPSTRLALRFLEMRLRGGERVLDYGCGSGILAIAAIKLGAAHATGIDIDTAALLAARQNAMQNLVAVQFEDAEQPFSAAYDIVLANILANPLKLLAPLLARATRGGGRLVLSGILEHQADELRSLYDDWFDMKVAQHDEGWALLSGVRR